MLCCMLRLPALPSQRSKKQERVCMSPALAGAACGLVHFAQKRVCICQGHALYDPALRLQTSKNGCACFLRWRRSVWVCGHRVHPADSLVSVFACADDMLCCTALPCLHVLARKGSHVYCAGGRSVRVCGRRVSLVVVRLMFIALRPPASQQRPPWRHDEVFRLPCNPSSSSAQCYTCLHATRAASHLLVSLLPPHAQHLGFSHIDPCLHACDNLAETASTQARQAQACSKARQHCSKSKQHCSVQQHSPGRQGMLKPTPHSGAVLSFEPTLILSPGNMQT